MLYLAFLDHLATLLPAQPRPLLLVAVSGGVDSVVLSHLLRRSQQHFIIAHCNFRLRGPESEADEQFVRQWAAQLGVPCHVRRFDTRAEALARRASIQETARHLRYEWLGELAQAEDCSHILTAHHANDSIETFLYNFAKGTGLRGLAGIPQRQGRVLRPLLIFPKSDILQYATQAGLEWREDSSNAETDYQRNLLRHEAVPALRRINPALERSSIQNFAHLREALALMDWALAEWAPRVCHWQHGWLYLHKAALAEAPSPGLLLFEWLRGMGFSPGQIGAIWALREGPAGKQVLSATHRCVNERQHFIVVPLRRASLLPLPVFAHDRHLDLGPLGRLLLSFGPPPQHFEADARVAYLDADKLQFPLHLRHWQAGDSFQPYGMGGRQKKVKALFSDLKRSLPEKEQAIIVLSGDAICWVAGCRSDHRFRVGPETRRVLRMEWRE